MSDSEIEQRRAAIDQAESRYDATQNPLYAWEAIHLCLGGTFDMPIPPWCGEYLRDAAANIFRLSCGRDFRAIDGRTASRIEPEDAFKLVARALSISSQGKRNAFARLKNDVDDVRAAAHDISVRDGVFTFVEGAGSKSIEGRRSVSRKTARRHIARGKKLTGVKPKTS